MPSSLSPFVFHSAYSFSQGMFQEASDILTFCKTKFPEPSKLSKVGNVHALITYIILLDVDFWSCFTLDKTPLLWCSL